MSPQRSIRLLCAVCLFIAVALPGCNPEKKSDPAKKENPQAKKDDHEHDEDEVGPRGGPVAEWKEFHAEFTVDHATKTATIYILDRKLKDIKVEPAKITKATLILAKPEVIIELKHDPKLSGEKMTVLIGIDDALGKKGDFEGTIKGTIDGKPDSGGFKYEAKKKEKAK